jgi:hypothetical protein
MNKRYERNLQECVTYKCIPEYEHEDISPLFGARAL